MFRPSSNCVQLYHKKQQFSVRDIMVNTDLNFSHVYKVHMMCHSLNEDNIKTKLSIKMVYYRR
jgi:hypothetical protein